MLFCAQLIALLKYCPWPKKNIFQHLRRAKRTGEKSFIVLVDPDKVSPNVFQRLLDLANQAKIDFFFVGGSLLVRDQLDFCLDQIGRHTSIPSILFPGNAFQINDKADGILFLSLISGRNPEFLIGQHVIAAPYLKKSELEIIPTAYILIDGGAPTSVTYMSNTTPIPHDKPEIAVCTALAGEMLGLKLIYLDAGSGARKPVSLKTIEAVSKQVSAPLIVGGGIRTPERVLSNLEAGADAIVVGNAIEKEPGLLLEMAEAVHGFNLKSKRVDVGFEE